VQVIAQCFAVGIGFAFGLAVVAMVAGACERIFGGRDKAREEEKFNVLCGHHEACERRLQQSANYMAVLAVAAKKWMDQQAKCRVDPPAAGGE
jgi:hypothetical protein